MKDLIRQIVSGYKGLTLEGQDEGYVVFSGKEPDTKQSVSIKILPRVIERNPEIARSFEGLARTIRQLNHPNIASIRKVGEEAGLPYLITRSIEKAQPLTARMNQPWAIDTAADVVMQVGMALEHAYKKGLVHGGLTPENVVLEDNGKVQVTDFGLNELQDIVGVQLKEAVSPFLAPERSTGGTANARVDVYSLAAILYSMLANRPPQVDGGQVVPPGYYNAEVPPAMDAVVVKALSPNPGDRHPDVRSFMKEFGAVSLVPVVAKALTVTAEGRCPNCGARDQTSRFCRKCGTSLRQPAAAKPATAAFATAASAATTSDDILAQPIQITKIDVGRVEVGKGVELQDTVIAKPRVVATGELLDMFPEPLEVPTIASQDLWKLVDDLAPIAVVKPPPMPVIDWAEIAPPMPEVPTFDDFLAEPEDD